MHIGLLGGAFNPPHIGHILVAQQVLDFTNVDEVWFLPNFGQSFPKNGSVTGWEHRLAMTNMIHMPRTRISTLEIDNKLDGQTIRLLPILPKKHDYHFIIGSDQLAAFTKWGNWEKLLEELPFYVFPRYGYPSEPFFKHMTLLSHTTLIATDISSEKIRERIARGLTAEHFVLPNVAQYIIDHKLYMP